MSIEHVSTAPERMGPTQRRLARMEAEAKVIARSKALCPKKSKNEYYTWEDIMAVGLAAEAFGLPANIHTIRQFHVIQGTPVPSTQLLCGVAGRNYGMDVWVEEATPERATAGLINPQTGREHKVTYTVEDARLSGALDFWYEQWVDGGVQKWVAGTTPEEVEASKANAPAWTKSKLLKSNPAWHAHRSDMLAWRALRRVLKRGAPAVVAGLPAEDEVYEQVMMPAAVPPERAAYPPVLEVTSGEGAIEVVGESEPPSPGVRGVPAEDGPPPSSVQEPPPPETLLDAKRAALKERIAELDAEAAARLIEAMADKDIPPLDHKAFTLDDAAAVEAVLSS